MDRLIQDIRYAVRSLRKSPGFSALAIATLALGIGANSTIFSWINGTLLNPIPGSSDISNVVTLNRSTELRAPRDFSYPDYQDLVRANHSFTGIAASAFRPVDITGGAFPVHTWATLTSANYFDILSVKPILGRGFLPTEDTAPGGNSVVVISYRLWQMRYGGDPHVVGKSLQVNQRSYEIVGVAPPAFQGSQTGLTTEMWIPVSMSQQIASNLDRLHARDTNWMVLQGKLAPGVTIAEAQVEMDGLMKRLAAEYPNEHQSENDVTIYPLWRGPFGANAYLYVLLPMLLAIAGFVLLLACANVANLVLVRSVSRRREVAVRLAVGATRWRLARQFMVESLILAVLAGVLAMMITAWTAGAFSRFVPPTNVPVSLNISANGRVLLVTFLISLLAGVIFGVIPAVRSSGLPPMEALKEDSTSSTGSIRKARLSSVLVVAQIALSLLLLVCSGLFIRSFAAAQRVDPGFDPHNVFLGSFNLFPAGYNLKTGVEFERQLIAKLQQIPGVESVTLADWTPLGYSSDSAVVHPEGYVPQAKESMDVKDADAGPGYFRTMRIPLVAGREFTSEDSVDSQAVAIVNQEFADRYWPGQNPLGKRVDTRYMKFTVIGVAKNAKYDRLDEIVPPMIYLPILQDYSAYATIHARVSGEPLTYAKSIEKAVHEMNANIPIFDEGTLERQVQIGSMGQRIAGTFVGLFGILALVLAAVGIYGLISYTTRQRTHELGIRLALGAQRGDVLRLVLGNGIRLIVAGLVLGFVLCLALTRFLRALLFQTGATDIVTFAAVGVLLAGVALLACYLPARRATRVDPMTALRFQ
ncbi:MAG: ABC transporter permease [Candidatus Acidiferrales bacterium]